MNVAYCVLRDGIGFILVACHVWFVSISLGLCHGVSSHTLPIGKESDGVFDNSMTKFSSPSNHESMKIPAIHIFINIVVLFCLVSLK